jgi:hypothetical protein
MTSQNAYITATPTTSNAVSYAFSLNDLDDVSNYTSVFDQYRIDAVVFRILPMQNAIGLSTNSTTTTCRLYCVVDYDDAAVLPSEATARAYESSILVPPGEECFRTFQPHQAVGAYGGSAFGNYTNVVNQWNDCNSPSTQHYGVKIFVTPATTGQTQLQSWSIEREYYISFRKTHG